jgi:hypothetical protein
MSKRQKFILSSVLLAIGLLALQFSEEDFRYQAIGLLTVFSCILTWWSLREALAGIRWLTTVILPVLFTAGVGLFYFLLPSLWLSQLPIVILYAVGFYALLLTENIFSVASIRTIQLLRAAHGVGFLLTLLTAFFLFDTIFSFRLSGWVNAVTVFCVSWVLYLHGLWSVNLEEKLSKPILLYSWSLALTSMAIAFVLSFYPVTVAMISLFLTNLVYVQLGIVQAFLEGRLFRRTINEYLLVGLVVLVIFLFNCHWSR